MTDEPDHISSLLNSSLRKMGIFTPVTTERAHEALLELLGADAANYVTRCALVRGVLTITVSNASFAMQLQYDGPRLVQALCERLGEGTVRSVKVRQ